MKKLAILLDGLFVVSMVLYVLDIFSISILGPIGILSLFVEWKTRKLDGKNKI